MPSTAYAFMTLPFLVLWIVLFLKSPSIRIPMLVMSALSGLAGPISEYWHCRDYWHPDYIVALNFRGWRFGIEDYALTFAMAGTVMALFEKFGAKKEWGGLPPVSWRCRLRLDMTGNFGILLMILFCSVIRMNSIYAILLTLLICSVTLYWKRRAWIQRALPVAAAFSIFYWAVFRFAFMPMYPGILERCWNLEALWGMRIAGVPVEEPLWAFGVALFAGPVYRACATGPFFGARFSVFGIRGSGFGRSET